jgi:hypothetical protein
VRAATSLLVLLPNQDLDPAFKGEIEQAREELTVEHRSAPSAAERYLPLVIKISGTLGGLSILGLMLGRGVAFEAAARTIGLSLGVTMIAAVTYLALAQRRRDFDTEFWASLWMGRIGKFVFGVARKLLGKRAIVPAMTHRATELSLGMAAEQLFESLPKESRLALGDLPALLRRLAMPSPSVPGTMNSRRHSAMAAMPPPPRSTPRFAPRETPSTPGSAMPSARWRPSASTSCGCTPGRSLLRDSPPTSVSRRRCPMMSSASSRRRRKSNSSSGSRAACPRHPSD